MAGIATTVWEYRATAGDANAGGGYDTAAGTTDYSNQDSAQLQLVDLVTSGIGVTTLTSVTGGFTAQMVGNYIQIHNVGTNGTLGFFRVTAHTDTNTVTLDRAPDDGVGGMSGASGDLGGALDIITNAFIEDTDSFVPGNTIYVKDNGVMTIGLIDTERDGSVGLRCRVIGYKSSRGDDPVGGDRPIIAMGGNRFLVDDYWSIEHLEFTGTGTILVRVDAFGLINNVKATNSSGTGNRNAIGPRGSPVRVVRCEGISTNGKAFGLWGGSGVYALSCYAHDSDIGILLDTGRTSVLNCVVESNTTSGIDFDNEEDQSVIGSVLYNNGVAIEGGTSTSSIITSNTITSNTTGVSFDTLYNGNFLDNNLFNSNSANDVINATKGSNTVSGTPDFTNAAGGDFTIGGSSSAIGSGLTLGIAEGLAADLEGAIGVDQPGSGGGGAIVNQGLHAIESGIMA